MQPPTSLVSPDGFLSLMSGEMRARRTLVEVPGVQVTQHRNGPGAYRVQGLADHGVAVQLSKSNRHTARIDGHGSRGEAGAGMSWLKPAGAAIDWRWRDPAEVVNVWISPGTWSAAVEAATGRDGTACEFRGRFVADDPFVAHVASAFLDAADRGGPYGRLLTDGLVAALIGHLAQTQGGRGSSPPRATGGLAGWRLRRVLEYLHANLAEDTPLAVLAGLAGLSERHFCTAFRRSMGAPPHRYRAERRVERAKGLLADPALGVTAVALAVGFGSGQHFATAFRRATGTTPSLYRERHGTG